MNEELTNHAFQTKKDLKVLAWLLIFIVIVFVGLYFLDKNIGLVEKTTSKIHFTTLN
jgi:hypothetical protein